MPTYVYKCDSCAAQFEMVQSFHDDPLKVCPECGQPTARRVINAVGIIFKGPGFYVTDNRKSSSNGKHNGRKREAERETQKSGETT